jgi:hypothetical protein
VSEVMEAAVFHAVRDWAKRLKNKFLTNIKSSLVTIYIYIYRCPRRNVPDFGRVFLMVKYTDITQNTYV